MEFSMPKFEISAPQMKWAKSESAALAAAVVQAVGVWLGWDISWLQFLVTIAVTYAGAYATVNTP